MSGPSLPPLLVFADDWGRHPSSCQHLIRQLLGRYQVYWVNTIGMRPPRLDLATLRRGGEKIRQWLSRRSTTVVDTPQPANPRVLNPRMWPWFSAPLDRRINRALLLRQLAPLLRSLNPPAIALTTIPVVADLIGALPVQRWVYYCVDDFGVWPGLDSRPLRRMEAELVRKADQVIAVSETLREKLRHMGAAAHLLTHGVDLAFWQNATGAVPFLDGVERPLIVFWGVLDRRMDVEFLRRLASDLDRGTILFAGPEADPNPALVGVPRLVRVGSLPFDLLPALAREAAVLVMPYADLPVTRAMQPLKLKEYLATDRPVVVRDLPATRAWADCADVAATPEAFSQAVRLRLQTGLPPTQRAARQRLSAEGWAEKARQLEHWMLEPSPCQVGEAGAAVVARSPDRATGPTEGLHELRETFGQSQWHGQETVPQQGESAAPSKGERPVVVLETRVVRGSGGGPDKTILNSPRFLTARGYRTICAYLHPPNDPGFEQLRAKARQWGAPLLSVPDHGFWDLGIIPRMLDICRRERVAVWHAHDYKSNALGLLLRCLWPMKLITTVHGWVHHTRRTPLYYGIDRLCLPHYDRVLCVSQDLYDRALACGVTAERCVLIENAIDLAEYTRTLSTAEAKQKLGIPPDRFVIGGVGRLSTEKGFDLLIRAVHELLKSGADVELVIAGEGDEKANLQAVIDQLNRQDRIHLLGYRSDTKKLFQAMDVFALSSLREGLPNVVLEAMALEVPVVATRVAGVPRLIHPDENGLLIDPGAAEQLLDALGRVLSDAALRSRLGQASRRTIEEKHSFRVRMDKIAALYDGLLNRPARRVTL